MPTRKTVAKKATAKRTSVRKTTTRTARPRVSTDTVRVARFGSSPVAITVNRGSSVRDVLDKAGISLSSTDKVYANGTQRVSATTMVYNGDVLSVISPKAAGAHTR